MDFISKLTKIALLTALGFGFFSCSNDDDAGDVVLPGNTIADYVGSNENFTSLAAALDAAGLTTTLAGDSNYTVFAPDNAAFNAFLSASPYSSLDEVPVELLREILLNHVLSGNKMSGELETGYITSMATGAASGENLSMYIDTSDGVTINGVADVTTADVEVENGVIHVVDAVIGLPDITTFAQADPTFDILVSALTREESYNFVETLQATEDPAPFTVFAPTNDAFGDFLTEMNFASLEDIPSDVLASVLSYHVVTGANVRSSDLTDGMMVGTFEGGEFTVNLGDEVTITDETGRTSTVIAADVQANNGVIHVIDTVLMPNLED